jgi:hypothetical protein
MTSLTDRAQSFPEAWKPNEGDAIEGVVTELATRASEYGPDYTIITVEDDGGNEWAIHGFHSMLRNEIERKTPQVGDRIAVAYHGLGESSAPGMSAPHKYRLVVERAAPSPPMAWETTAGVPGDVPAPGGYSDDIPFA